MNFGGIDETVITREEFPLSKAREVLKDETIAILGYGVQGPGQSLNLPRQRLQRNRGPAPRKKHYERKP